MNLHDAMIYVRAAHFAACILAAGVVFFAAFIAAPSSLATGLRSRIAAIAWISLAAAVVSGAVWLTLTAQAMSEQPLAEVLSQGVIWTVLSQTDFGNDWLLRLILAVLLAATFPPLLRADRSALRWIAAAAVVIAAALVGSLAWAGHAIGAPGLEGTIHPAADVLHLAAAAAWVGTLPLLAMLLATAERDAVSMAIARTAIMRFSTLGIVSVGSLLATGIVNTWYLVGSVSALLGTPYGRLLLVKVALFFAMVGVAAINRLRLTPRISSGDSAAAALRQLRHNAIIETLGGAGIVFIVAMLGTLPPGSHANHHPAYGALPADAAFVHIHTEQGMADVMISPGRVGTARATIRLWNGDFGELDAKSVTFALAGPAASSKPATRVAVQASDGAWQVDNVELAQPGNWTVTVNATLSSNSHLVLDAPIVIESDR
jgi:putative copper resistance protein D